MAPVDEPRVTKWNGPGPATEGAIRAQMESEGHSFYAWGNGPGDRYAAHSHAFHKIIYVAQGSITFALPDLGRSLVLTAGDRLYLPAGVRHSAVVGEGGVLCFESQLPVT